MSKIIKLRQLIWKFQNSELILEPFRHFIYVRAHFPTLPSLYLRLSSFSKPSVALPKSQLILEPFRHFIYVTIHPPTLQSLYLLHSSFSNPSVDSPMSQLFSFSNISVTSTKLQLILQPFRRFTYVTAHSLSSFSQLIFQPFRHFIYVTTHSPTLPSLFLRHSSFFNPSVASPTSQFIILPFCRFSYVTSSSLNSHGEPSMHLATAALAFPVVFGPTLH